jgi:hypothetical protein
MTYILFFDNHKLFEFKSNSFVVFFPPNDKTRTLSLNDHCTYSIINQIDIPFLLAELWEEPE